MSNKRKIAKDTLFFSGSSLFSQTIAFGLAIYIRNVLGVEAMGLWAFLQVILSYLSYTNLGVMSAVCREVPVLRGRGESEERIQGLKDAGYTYLSVIAFVTSGGVAIAALILRSRVTEFIFYGLLTISLITLMERNVGYLVQVLYTEKKFQLVSRFRAYSSLVNAALVLVLCWNFYLYGFFAATLLSFVFDWLYLKWKSNLVFHWRWNSERIKELVKFGVPMSTLVFVVAFFNSIDKVVIGKHLGLADLGIYTIALLAGRYLFLLPNMFQVVLLPETLEKFGDEANEVGRKNYSTFPTRLMIVYFSLGIPLMWIGARYGCELLLPKYVDGVPALKALVFGYAFMALSQQIGHLLLGYKRHLWMLPVALVFSVAVWGLSVFSFSRGGGAFHAAVWMSLFQLFYYLISSWFALSKIYDAGRLIRHLLINLIPFAYLLAVLLIFDRWWPADDLLAILGKSALYLLLWLGLFWALEKEMGIFKLLKETWSARSKRPAVAS